MSKSKAMQDYQAYETIQGDPSLGLIFLADHATNALPQDYRLLGLPEASFSRHIAYDIGIEALTRLLAAGLGVPAVMSRFSRLLIDPNRGEDDPTLIMQISDGARIPGNSPLTAAERQHRLDAYYRPYHKAVADGISTVARASRQAPLVISLHSFTPAWKGRARPWHAGVLWDNDPRAARRLIEDLAGLPSLVVGDNEPYDGALKGDTMYRHCMINGTPHALLEIRQDLIGTQAGVEEWCERLKPIFEAMNADERLHAYDIHVSRTGPYD